MNANARERADIIVAADGEGGFRSIQEALESIPPDKSASVVTLPQRLV